MKRDNAGWHYLAERFGPQMIGKAIDDLQAARKEIDRLDDEVARLRDSRQAVWNTLTSRVATLSHLQVAIDRISAMHEADDPDSDIPYCPECEDPWPCRTAAVIRRYR